MSAQNGWEMECPVFPFMDEISFLSYEQFTKAVADARAQMRDIDKQLIMTKNPERINWNDIDETFSGRFDTVFQGVYLECFMHIKPEKPLYVMLNGANSGKETRFSRWSYFSFCGGSVLCIADPMLKMYEKLTLGWYYGNGDLNLRKIIAEFVQVIAEKIGVCNENIIFVGSSGGGAATFECASYIPGAKVAAINPQIVLKEYYYADEFSRITGNDLQNDLFGHRNNALYFIKKHAHNPYLIIANLHSAKDMEQIANIKNELAINIQYGLNLYDNLIIWLYDADVAPVMNPHEAQEYYCIWFFIEYLLGHMNSLCDREINAAFRSLYRLVNEFWYDHWFMKRVQKEKVRGFTEILKRVMNTDREVVLFGSGSLACRMLNDVLDVQDSNFFRIRYIIDNDRHKAGKELLGCRIRHPSEIKNWNKLYILIATELYALDVRKQLEDLGLMYQEDFIYGIDIL